MLVLLPQLRGSSVLQKPKKPLRIADDELDDAPSVQIILVIRIVHIIFLSNFHTKGPSGHLASRVFSSL